MTDRVPNVPASSRRHSTGVGSPSDDWQELVVVAAQTFPQIDQSLISHEGKLWKTQMRINGESVRALREQKSWSQEHLANASGLSVRTIQRVEVEGIASAETRLALAGGLDVPVAELMPTPPSNGCDGRRLRFPTLRVRRTLPSRAEATLMRKTLVGFGIRVAFAFAYPLSCSSCCLAAPSSYILCGIGAALVWPCRVRAARDRRAGLLAGRMDNPQGSNSPAAVATLSPPPAVKAVTATQL